MSNKVIFLRSNGQQEVLYLKERDAKLDPAYTFIDDWTTVIKPITATQFAVNVHEFAGRVHSLAQFIDMLDLTGVYQQGTSIGCRVGTITPPSLALSLGLERGDIILSVNGIPATTTANRFAIYQELTALKTNRTIPVTVIRNGSEITLSYELRETIVKPVVRDTQRRTADQITQEQLKRLEERETFAPTIDELRARERRNMLEKGKRPIQNMLSNVE
jgi:type II secretory pathway component PulC